jgi:23S rRNA (cytosine1962-C5)-methyltransferase
MSQPEAKNLMFYNRLVKVHRHLGKQAVRQGISCYRLYDHDLPEFPFLIEVFGDVLYVSEYKRRHDMAAEEHERWLAQCKEMMGDLLGIHPQNIYVKLRQRKESRLGQYQKLDAQRSEIEVTEGGLKFLVNLTDYLDTGLFLDHRVTRGMVRAEAEGKRVLNLFCYTGSFSVYAAAGGAAEVVSVDLSKTYLDWAGRNMQLNYPQYPYHQLVHADVLAKLKELPAESFDLIVLDPPTFSNSKRMEGILDVQRDHAQLIEDCLRLLATGGVIYFSTNFTKFKLESDKIKAAQIKDITKATTPFDFTGRLQRACFKIWK